jgi:hypothetical protein
MITSESDAKLIRLQKLKHYEHDTEILALIMNLKN